MQIECPNCERVIDSEWEDSGEYLGDFKIKCLHCGTITQALGHYCPICHIRPCVDGKGKCAKCDAEGKVLVDWESIPKAAHDAALHLAESLDKL